MVFVTVGSQKFPFDRLLQSVDACVRSGVIKDEVFAQTGYCNYSPQLYAGLAFLSRDEFLTRMASSDVVITHGGTGVIINGLKKGKKIIAMPRLARYGEHVDDHQVQIVDMFDSMNLISSCLEGGNLGPVYERTMAKSFSRFESGNDRFVSDLDGYLALCCKEKEGRDG